MNSELALLDDDVAKDDKFIHVIAQTVVESGLEGALEVLLKEMALPLGVGLTF